MHDVRSVALTNAARSEACALENGKRAKLKRRIVPPVFLSLFFAANITPF
jgi:hypothetical protein